MRQKRTPPPLDRAIAELAGRQWGVVAARQLRALGLDDAAVRRRQAAGRLHRVHRGVYAVGHEALSVRGRAMAAVLAAGPGVVLSHRSAAHAWAILSSPPPEPEVTVTGRHKERTGIRLHRTRRLDMTDVTHRHAIPITTPARTLLDLAEVLPQRRLERALGEAEVLKILTRAELTDAIRRHPGRRGLPVLTAVLSHDHAHGAITRSALEDKLLALIRDAGLPHPETNRRVVGFEVDFLWRAERLVVETDGFAFHGTRAAFERDRARDSALQAAGYRVIRVTARRLSDAAGLARELRALLTPPAPAPVPSV